jgi:hypothetical protein
MPSKQSSILFIALILSALMIGSAFAIGSTASSMAAPSNTGTESMPSPTTATLCGRVVDMATGEPVLGAWIVVGQQSVYTQERTGAGAGSFCLAVPPGRQRIEVEAEGYIGMVHTGQELAAGEYAEVLLEMIASDPAPDQAAALDDIILRQQRVLGETPDDMLDPLDHERGYALSAVTQVPETIRVLMPDGQVVVMDMEEYLKGVVPSEMPASWHPDALRAQAVAARSYASVTRKHAHEGADLCTTTHCQVWKPTQYTSTNRAVEDTRGIVGRHSMGRIISAFYFAHSDGYTRNSEDVWSTRLDYCRSVSSPCGYDYMRGHGVGLAQVGTGVMARQGYPYEAILKHYYTGISVSADPNAGANGQIVDARVSPTTGDENTLFTFTLVYRANDNAGTASGIAVANVIINGHAHALDRVWDEGGAEGTMIYRLSTHLPPGEHTYRFFVEESQGLISRWPASGAQAGPVVQALAQPSPPPASGIQVHSLSLSTEIDWLAGAFENTRVTTLSDGSLTLAHGHAEGSYTSTVLTAPHPFIAVGATWLAALADANLDPDDALGIEVRVSQDGVAWGPWLALSISEDGTARRDLQASDLVVAIGQKLQARITLRRTSPSAPAPILKDLRLVCIDSSDGPSAPAVAQAPLRPRVITRSEWGADESLMTWMPAYRPVQAVVVHHTAFGDETITPAAAIRAIYHYHAVVREWGDIGYNFLVDRQGNIYEGRAGGPGVVGGHARPYNPGSIGISLIGNFEEEQVPQAMREGLVRFIAWQAVDHLLDPLGEGYFIDKHLPTIFGHRDGANTICPGRYAYALLPSIRQEVRQTMNQIPPSAVFSWPVREQHLRAVADLQVRASVNTNEVRFYVNGQLRAVDSSAPFTWKWNTSTEPEATHTLRIVPYNQAGEGTAFDMPIIVDNTPPGGSPQAPPWTSSRAISVTIENAAPATAVQFSNDWVWNAQDLSYTPGSGIAIDDDTALSGKPWLGRGGIDTPGAWYGPYTCALPTHTVYDVYFRYKTSDNGGDTGLATLDVVDHQASDHTIRIYDQRALSTSDFGRANTYEDVRLAMDYRGGRSEAPPTCEAGHGVEFRTWFSSAGDLYLDRVAVFAAARPLMGGTTSTVSWTLSDEDGPQRLLVRLLDQAGNAAEHELTVGLDRAAPHWFHYGVGSVWVQDRHAGLDPQRAEWSTSHDGGGTWSNWQPLTLTIPPGTTQAIPLNAGDKSGTHIRFRLADMLGQQSESAAIPLRAAPTPTATPRPDQNETPVLLPLILSVTP